MKKTFLYLLAIILAALLPAAALAEERGFDTPEACVQALFTALQAQDTQALEECIAFDELAARFDFQAQAERLLAVMGNMFSYLPVGTPFAVQYNRMLLERAWYARLAAFGLRSADPAFSALYGGYSYTSKSPEYEAVLEAAGREGLFNIFPALEYKGVIRPGEIESIADKYVSDRNQENLRRMMAIWRVSNYEELGILFSTSVDTMYAEGAQYVIPLRVIEIDGRWLADPDLPVLGYLLGMGATDFVAALP